MKLTKQNQYIEEVRAQLVDAVLASIAVFALLQVFIFIFRNKYFSDPSLFVQIFVQIFIISIFLLRKSFSRKTKGWLIVICGLLAGFSGIANFGLAGSGILALMTTVVISAYMLGFAISLVLAGICVVGLILFLFFLSTGQLSIAINVNDYMSSSISWITVIFGFTYMVGILLFVYHRFFSVLRNMNNQLNTLMSEKQTEAEKSDTLLKAVLDAVPYRVFWKGLDLNYLGANKAFLKDACVEQQSELVGKSDLELIWTTEQAEKFRADDLDVMQSSEPKLSIEEEQSREGGHKGYLLTNKVPLISKDGKVFGVLGTYDDITERKLMELDLDDARKNADNANKAKSDFLANMSHEIRTPLNGINGLINLCMETNLTDEQQSYLKNAKVSVSNLKVIIDDVLDISKIEAKKLELESVAFSPSLLVENLFSVMKAQADDKGIIFEVDNSIDNQIELVGDPTRLLQIFINLVSNAIKFTNVGQVTVSISWDESSSMLSFSVTDSGIGVTPEQQRSLFDSFSQADTSITRKVGGTGLGLSIVKSLVGLMHGDISVSSVPNKGSVFFGYIIAPQSKNKQRLANKKVSDSDLSGISILLVEDNAINRMIAEKTLLSENATVTLACDGIEALEQLEQHSFDLVLMDIQMPNMDGMEAVAKIRASEHYKQVPVIALTANVLSHEVSEYYKSGFNSHLPKPFEREALRAEILRLLS